MKKNRILVMALALALCMGLLCSCGNNSTNSDGNSSTSSGAKKYSVVCTIFPEYDWVREVVGDKVDDFEITLLLDNGVDLHNYQPTAADMAKISNCDLFLYVGGESDGWVEDALAEATNKDMKVVNLLDSLGDSVKEEELVEGMQGEEEEGAEDEEEPEYDEHVWLSLKNSQTLVKVIGDAIAKMDSKNADVYKNNADGYIAKLSALDRQYAEVVKNAATKTVLFGDRFPFRYLVDDYGINYYAAFVGCSAETEASFETITFLSGKVDELSLKHVLVIESSDKKIAETIIKNTASKDQDILVLDSMQSTTSKDVANGVTYLSIMEKNFEVLKNVLK